MGQALRALFAVERARTEDVLASLEKEMRPLYGVVTAAWVRGPLLTDLFEADDSLVITVVALRVDHRRVRSMLQRRITAIGASSGIQIRLELRSLPPHTSKPRHITVPRDALVLERAAPAAPRLPVCGEPP